jgi:hypothetical protein
MRWDDRRNGAGSTGAREAPKGGHRPETNDPIGEPLASSICREFAKAPLALGEVPSVPEKGPQDFGLFSKDHLVAKSGQTIGGKVISTAGAPFLGLPAVNNRGEVVFTALTGAGTSPNDLAIFTRDAVICCGGRFH